MQLSKYEIKSNNNKLYINIHKFCFIFIAFLSLIFFIFRFSGPDVHFSQVIIEIEINFPIWFLSVSLFPSLWSILFQFSTLRMNNRNVFDFLQEKKSWIAKSSDDWMECYLRNMIIETVSIITNIAIFTLRQLETTCSGKHGQLIVIISLVGRLRQLASIPLNADQTMNLLKAAIEQCNCFFLENKVIIFTFFDKANKKKENICNGFFFV